MRLRINFKALFRRMVFNILIDNTKDHEKNHALVRGVAYVKADAMSINESLASPPLAQNSAIWGLDRIDQVVRPLSSQYLYQCTGAAIYASVLVTGTLANQVIAAGNSNANA